MFSSAEFSPEAGSLGKGFGPVVTAAVHDRLRPGLNHLAFHAGTRGEVDALAAGGPANGWTLMFADRHPHAGGQDHYAAYLTSTDGFEVELVAGPPGPMIPVNKGAMGQISTAIMQGWRRRTGRGPAGPGRRRGAGSSGPAPGGGPSPGLPVRPAR